MNQPLSLLIIAIITTCMFSLPSILVIAASMRSAQLSNMELAQARSGKEPS